MQISSSQRIESIGNRDPSYQVGSVREATLIFVSKPEYEASQHVYVLRQDLPRIDSMFPLSALDHVTGPNALLLLGGLMLNDRANKKLTLSNHMSVYYQHLIFFSHLVNDGEIRAPDLSAGTLYSLLCALRSQEIRPHQPHTHTRSHKAHRTLNSTPIDDVSRFSFLEALCHAQANCADEQEASKKNRCIFEIQP